MNLEIIIQKRDEGISWIKENECRKIKKNILKYMVFIVEIC